jgi:exodeoxyribonuclease-3
MRLYTYWSYFSNAKRNNKGWRLDYTLVNNRYIDRLKSSYMIAIETKSDHIPIICEI